MLNLLFFHPAGEAPPHVDDLATLLVRLGASITAADGSGYRPWRWQDPATAAACEGDLGTVILDGVEAGRKRVYPGWETVPLSIIVPLAVPAWQCIEIGGLTQSLLTAVPGLAVLISEDTSRADGSEGPGPLDPAQLLRCFRELREAQVGGVADLPRMDVTASQALWHYRRERAAGMARHPDLVWPQALVLAEAGEAFPVAFWLDPRADLALPPVTHVVLPRADGPGLLPVDEVLVAAGGAEALGLGLSRRVRSNPALVDLHQRARLLPSTRFTACAEDGWVD